MEVISQQRLFGGSQFVLSHRSKALNCQMRFAAFVPQLSHHRQAPALLWLSGLTCTEENFTVKAGAQRVAAELGLILLMPDTSPRGDGVPDDEQGAYDFGLGAGFYVDATEAPWQAHYQMRTYIEKELLADAARMFAIDSQRVGISGHSMGGHGALTMGLRNPEQFRSVSAFAPICAPAQCHWGRKAFAGYLGPDERCWRAYDACAMIVDGARVSELLVEQGGDDEFLEDQLMPQKLQQACAEASIPLTLRLQPGYDHSYYFIASFIEEHLHWHAERLRR